MASVMWSGIEKATPLREVLQQFYGNAKKDQFLYRLKAKDTFRSGTVYPVFHCIMNEDSLVLELIEEYQESRVLYTQTIESNPRRQMKKLLYHALSNYNEIYWPWGALGGIRPTYVAKEFLLENDSNQAEEKLVDEYYLMPEKAKILVKTSQIENRILASIPKDAYAIYIGVPFCPTRCSYCSFTTPEGIGTSGKFAGVYLQTLEKEVEHFLHWKKDAFKGPLAAVYVGGGTPADFSNEDFVKFIEIIKKLDDPSNQVEWTVELGRADVITPEKIACLQANNIHRICINPQSFKENTLARIGRPHSKEVIYQAYLDARQGEMKVINLDFIAGLEGESNEAFLENIEEAILWQPDAITIHTLALKRGSNQYTENKQGKHQVLLAPDYNFIQTVQKAHEMVMAAGYEPYYLYRHRLGKSGLENISFAKNKAECVYNLIMMSDRFPIVSFGTPAISKRMDGYDAKRFPSPKSLHQYLLIDEHFLARKQAHFLTQE